MTVHNKIRVRLNWVSGQIKQVFVWDLSPTGDQVWDRILGPERAWDTVWAEIKV